MNYPLLYTEDQNLPFSSHQTNVNGDLYLRSPLTMQGTPDEAENGEKG